MFLKKSRYYGIKTVVALDSRAREVTAVTIRQLPPTTGSAVTVKDGMQLDVESERRYKDGTRYWHIADAGTELEANKLVERSGRSIAVPDKS